MRIISVCVLQEIKINNKTLHTLPLEQFASGSIFTSRFLPAITQPEQQVEQISRIHHPGYTSADAGIPLQRASSHAPLLSAEDAPRHTPLLLSRVTLLLCPHPLGLTHHTMQRTQPAFKL